MKKPQPTLEPIGDQAVLATFAAEAEAGRFAAAVRSAAPPWLVDVVLAYVSVAVFFDCQQTNIAEVTAALDNLPLPTTAASGRLHLIPCCYERQLDLQRVSTITGVNVEEVISLHTSIDYQVYAIGFCPGFPYLGYLPEKLRGVPRLDQPRLRVDPGSVGLTGTQTGIYPLPRPAGWHLIGQTPLELVHIADGYFPIRTGDRVRFQRIDEAEFNRLKGERLASDAA